MKRDNRILKNEQFQTIIKVGKLTRTNLCYVYYCPNELGVLRVGIAVSKKIGNAVVRNKIKRQAKAIVRKYVVTHEGDFVIIAKKAILDQSFADLEQAIAAIFNKNGVKK